MTDFLTSDRRCFCQPASQSMGAGFVMPRGRLYIDESGDHIYPGGAAVDSTRYLGLTGICVEDTYYQNVLAPGLEALKA